MGEPITQYVEKRFDADANGCWPPEASGPLSPGEFRVLFKNGVAEMCVYLCPCGCGMPHPTYFTTADRQRTAARHLWDYSPGPTLSPSVRCTGGCKAHYNITGGRTVMCDCSRSSTM